MSSRPTSLQRYRAAEAQAEYERSIGIFDRPLFSEQRLPFDLPLACVGWKNVRIEPRTGFISWRCIEIETGDVLHCAALKELLRWVARRLPRMRAARNFQ